jgi:acyl carrier protein
MLDKIKNIIASQMNIDPQSITLKTDLINDLGVNSLAMVELICAFEQEFGIEVPEQDFRKFRQVEGIVNYLGQLARG